MKIVTGFWGMWGFSWGSIPKLPTLEEHKALMASEDAFLRIFQKDKVLAEVPVSSIPLYGLDLGPYVFPSAFPLEGMRYEAPAWFKPHFVVEELP